MMKKSDRVLRQILYNFYERGEPFMSQKALAKACGVSLGTINSIVARIEGLGAIEKKPLGFRVTGPNRVLTYWSATRNLAHDIVYSTYTPNSVSEIEAQMPPSAIFTGYSGYKLKFGALPADYDEVHVYADPKEIKRRFRPRGGYKKNLFVLSSDQHLESVSHGRAAPLAQIYVDLWQLGKPADRFVDELDRGLELGLIGTFKDMVKRVQKKI